MKGLVALIVLAVIWASGFLAFVARVERSTPPRDPGRAQGVVALTGAGSNERIGAAMELLENGRAQRMLVSGVSREASREDIRMVSRAARRLYDCCVDLGFSAANTVGNARETQDWARAMRFDSLIVVTADYHMPRAMLELRGAMPEARLIAYPVRTSVVNPARWWRTTGGVRLMVGEYSKYLAILGREAVLSLGPRSEAAVAAKKG
jgi:uncharacterized SAM-binding protein YcdF (DUF218 family)